MNNTHLFLFTPVPMQRFIAQARTTRDLSAGSQRPSKLVHTGMYIFAVSGCKVLEDIVRDKAINFDICKNYHPLFMAIPSCYK